MNQTAYLLLALLVGIVIGYALGLWADNWGKPAKEIKYVYRPHTESWTESAIPAISYSDLIKNIKERNSVSEYDSDATQDQTKTNKGK